MVYAGAPIVRAASATRSTLNDTWMYMALQEVRMLKSSARSTADWNMVPSVVQNSQL
jgi:hypothetical protein